VTGKTFRLLLSINQRILKKKKLHHEFRKKQQVAQPFSTLTLIIRRMNR